MGLRQTVGTRPEPDGASGCVTLSQEEWSLLLGGLDLSQTRRQNWYRKAA